MSKAFACSLLDYTRRTNQSVMLKHHMLEQDYRRLIGKVTILAPPGVTCFYSMSPVYPTATIFIFGPKIGMFRRPNARCYN